MTKLTPKKAEEWRPIFLETLRQTGNVRLACKTAGVSREAAYKSRANSEAFAADWESAHDDAIDTLEAIARQRASTTSDTLLIFLLKAHRPKLYRENSRTLQISVTPAELAKMTDEELDELERRLATS